MSQSKSFITDSIIQAADWLQQGQLLAYPTESVWGIGCDAYDKKAVQHVLEIKQRPQAKGMIVVTDSVDRITPLLKSLNLQQRQTVLKSWHHLANTPVRQAYTWVLPLNKALAAPIPEWVTGAHASIAVRVIAHPLIQQLCAQMVSPNNPYGFIVSTSCNPSGLPPAKSLIEAQAYFAASEFAEQVGYLQGETLGYQLPSQIRDALTGQIIR